MPAHPAEIKEGLDEGLKLVNLRQITGIDGKTLTLETMAQGEGRELVRTGQTETIEADVVVQALGQSGEFSAFAKLPGIVVSDGAVQVGKDLMTGAAGVFAGGDMIPSQRNVTVAIGLGKKAARNIDAFLRKARYEPKPKAEVAGVEMLNTWYYSDAPRTIRPMLDVVRRTSGFAEVVGNLDEETAVVRSPALHELRQLLRVRQLLRRLPGQRGGQARRPATASSSTSTTARAAASACRSVLVARSRWCRRRSDLHVAVFRAVGLKAY